MDPKFYGSKNLALMDSLNDIATLGIKHMYSTSHEQVVSSSWTSHKQIVYKSWTSHERIMHKSRISHKRKSDEKEWTVDD